MSIQTEIDRINSDIADAYTAVNEKSGTMPSSKNSANLPAAIRSIVLGTGGISKTNLIEALQYSGLGLTEDSTDEEILAALEYAFPPYEYLFRANRENVLTGGWNTSTQASSMTEPAVDSDGYLSATMGASQYLNRIHKTGFDLTNYTKCYFTVEALTASNGNANSILALGFYTANNAGNTKLPTAYCSFNGVGVFSFDITDLSGTYYPGIMARYRQAGDVKFSAIYLQ